MTRWTPEQELAIKESGKNIIVSAGAGSGKTAVLSERVINKLNNNVHINELLILTFTKAAASEMKERIRKKILSNDNLSYESELLSSAYITTFDSYALSIVKKYHYLLNISPNISISDESIVKVLSSKIMDKIFERLYEENNNDFLELIDKYSIKNDKEIRNNILSIAEAISSKINYEEYINNIKDNFYTSSNVDKIYNDYLKLLKSKLDELHICLDDMSYYFDYETMMKFNNSLDVFSLIK